MKRVTMRIPDSLAADLESRLAARRRQSGYANLSQNDYLLEILARPDSGPAPKDQLRDHMLAAGLVQLSVFAEAELDLIRDACNGYGINADLHGDYVAARWIDANVEDSIRMNRFDTKWEVDAATLLAKLRGLTIEGRLALLEDIRKFWEIVEVEQ